jgi:hypothetical protein
MKVPSGETTMENFIVRIYRYEKNNPNRLMGIVEKVGEEGKKAFIHVDELWEILNQSRAVSKHEVVVGRKK